MAAAAAAALVAASPWVLSGAVMASGQTFTFTSTVTYGRPAASTNAGAVLGLPGGGTVGGSSSFVSTQQSSSLTGSSGQLVGTSGVWMGYPTSSGQVSGSTATDPALALLLGQLGLGQGGQITTYTYPGTAPASTTGTPPVGSGSAPSGSAVCNPAAGTIQYVLCLTNEQRARAGSQPLALDPALDAIAQQRATALAALATITHDIPGLGYAAAMETSAGVTGMLIGGEDLSTGSTVDQAFSMLATSPEHLANMQYASYNAVGIAVAPMASGILVLDLLFIER